MGIVKVREKEYVLNSLLDLVQCFLIGIKVMVCTAYSVFIEIKHGCKYIVGSMGEAFID